MQRPELHDEVPLGDLLLALIDYRGRTPSKAASGVRLITAKVIKNGRIDTSRAEYISNDTYLTWMRRGIPERGDILVTTEAPLGEVAQLRTDERVALAQRVILLRPNPRLVNPQFLFHFLRSEEALVRMRQRSSGTTVSGIRQPELRAVRIPMLSNRQQAGSAVALDAFDDLIEINERRIELLEDLARSLYREWFARYESMRVGEVSLIESATDMIPAGWNVQALSDIAGIVMGQSPKSEFYNELGEGLPFHQGVSDYGRLLPIHRIFSTDGSRVAEAWDVLCSVRAPVGRLNLADRKLVVGRGLAAVRRHDGKLALLFEQLAAALGAEDSIGGGTIFKAVGKSELADLPVIEPATNIGAQFECATRPMLDERVVLTLENRHLAATRDLLLPRLVTGRLDISDIDLGDLLPEEIT